MSQKAQAECVWARGKLVDGRMVFEEKQQEQQEGDAFISFLGGGGGALTEVGSGIASISQKSVGLIVPIGGEGEQQQQQQQELSIEEQQQLREAQEAEHLAERQREQEEDDKLFDKLWQQETQALQSVKKTKLFILQEKSSSLFASEASRWLSADVTFDLCNGTITYKDKYAKTVQLSLVPGCVAQQLEERQVIIDKGSLIRVGLAGQVSFTSSSSSSSSNRGGGGATAAAAAADGVVFEFIFSCPSGRAQQQELFDYLVFMLHPSRQVARGRAIGNDSFAAAVAKGGSGGGSSRKNASSKSNKARASHSSSINLVSSSSGVDAFRTPYAIKAYDTQVIHINDMHMRTHSHTNTHMHTVTLLHT